MSEPMYRNLLLQRLPESDLALLSPLLEPTELVAEQVLDRAGEPIEHVYFPESGIASLIASVGGRERLEAGPFGREGMSGLPVVLHGDRSPNETRVQIGGAAHRMPAGDLRRVLAESPAIRERFSRYALAFSAQTTETLVATGFSVVELRLARWILMLHDRVDGDEFALTHGFMALMLAVRRPGITVALHELEGRGLIRSKRAQLVVRDRPGLERLCGNLYGTAAREYERLLGTPDTTKRGR